MRGTVGVESQVGALGRRRAGIENDPSNGGVGCAGRPQINRHVRAVAGEIVGIFAAAVPDRPEDDVSSRHRRGVLRHAVDFHVARVRAEFVGRRAVVGAEVRPIHVLQRGDVEHHQTLGFIIRGLIRANCRSRKVPVGHHGEFRGVPVCGQVAEMIADAGIAVGMVEPQCMTDLVHERRVAVVAFQRIGHVVGAAGSIRVVPHVAPSAVVVISRRAAIGGRNTVSSSDPLVALDH